MLAGNGEDFHFSPEPNALQKHNIDLVFPLIHGSFGEDGRLQGLLEIMAIPYIGPGVAASAIAIDKDLTKRMLLNAQIAVTHYVTLHKNQTTQPDYTLIWRELGGKVCFVKPARCGSSIGISKVTQCADLAAAIDEAFKFDTKVLVEQGIEGREIECAILQSQPTIASVLGEVVPPDGFYSYDAKYIDDNAAQLIAPADLPKAASDKIRKMAVRVFETLGLEGMSRIDFFYTKNETIYVNEVNTIPGFTKISMYPRLLGLTQITYTELITSLAELALKRFDEQKELTY